MNRRFLLLCMQLNSPCAQKETTLTEEQTTDYHVMTMQLFIIFFSDSYTGNLKDFNIVP